MTACPRPSPASVRAEVILPDLAGMAWEHPDARRLLRWISKRNELLRTISAASQREGQGIGRREWPMVTA